MTSPPDEALDWLLVWTGTTEPSGPTLAVIERLGMVDVELGNLVPVDTDFFVSCVVDEDSSVPVGVSELAVEDCRVTSPVDRTLDWRLGCTPVAEPSSLLLDVSEISSLLDVVLGKLGPSDTDLVVSGALGDDTSVVCLIESVLGTTLVVDDDPSTVCLPVSLLDVCETVSAKEFEGGMLVWLSDEAGVTSAVSPLEDSER